MNNENNLNTHHHHHHHSPQPLNYKLATLLALIITFQQKIQLLRTKLCGHPTFSPQTSFTKIDVAQKGYITTSDLTTFLKKSKPSLNIQQRYLQILFMKLNQDQRVPVDRLSYFGYLNAVKPYFDVSLARDVLMRGGGKVGGKVGKGDRGGVLGEDQIGDRLLEELFCVLWVCVAEHQRVKEGIVYGDLEEGGSNPGCLYNVYEILNIIRQNGQPSQPTSIQLINSQTSINPNPNTHIILPTNTHTNTNIHINTISVPQIPTSQILTSENTLKISTSNSKPSLLDTFYNFIVRNSQYEIQRPDMKYLLAYLMCHQFRLAEEKFVMGLFMPVWGTRDAHLDKSNQQQGQSKDKDKSSTTVNNSNNFLTYIHPNSISDSHLENYRKKTIPTHPRPPPQPHKKLLNPLNNPQPDYNINSKSNLDSQSFLNNYQKYPHQPYQHSSQKIIQESPRKLLAGSHVGNNLQTPLLQKFMRQSKVLKNMSRYQQDPIQQQQSNSSAFDQYQPQSQSKPLPNSNPTNQNFLTVEHKQKPINKDFNLHDMLNNSNLHQSQYYQNLSVRGQGRNYEGEGDRKSSRNLGAERRIAGMGIGGMGEDDGVGSGILGNFMLR